MLNCTWNTDGHIQLRGHHFTSLANLHVIGTVSCINSSPRSTDSCISKSVSKSRNHWKIFFAFYSSSSWYDNSCSCELRFAWIRWIFFDKTCFYIWRKRNFFNWRRTLNTLSLIKGRSSKGQKIKWLISFHFRKGITCIGRSHISVFSLFLL